MDPLPSGNILGAYWSTYYSNSSEDDQAQAGLIEVVRDTKQVAWHMRVYGKACDDADCNDGGSKDYGWKFYSAERFYDGPLLPTAPAHGHNASLPSCDDGELSFTVFNSFKQSSPATGTFTLTEPESGHVAAHGEFDFAEYWKPTVVSGVSVTFGDSNAASKQALLNVSNSRGRHASYTLQCTGL